MDLAVLAYELTALPKFKRDFALTDQIHRAALSVPSNVAEGFERGTRPEFQRFLMIAKASCAELRTHIHLARRIGYLDRPTANAALAQAEEVGRIIGGLKQAIAKKPRG